MRSEVDWLHRFAWPASSIQRLIKLTSEFLSGLVNMVIVRRRDYAFMYFIMELSVLGRLSDRV